MTARHPAPSPLVRAALLPALAVGGAAGAASLQTQHNEVADGTIVVDFNAAGDRRADWVGIDPYTPLDVDTTTPVLGIESIAIAHDSNDVFFRLFVDAFDPNNPQQSFFGAHHSIFLDTDRDRTTGYIGDDGDPNLTDGVLPIGADFLIQGPALFRFGNLANPGGANQELFTWGGIIPFGNMIFDDDPVSDIEFTFERSQINTSDGFDFFVLTDTDPDFVTQDIFPNNSDVIDGDFFTYSFLPIASEILGDYNDNGLVEQGDLNQVLNNWGTDFASVSASWINQRPTEGIVDQAELNVVLNRWGSDSAPDFSGSAVPEPASLVLLSAPALFLRSRQAR